MAPANASASVIAAAVGLGTVSAREVVVSALERIAALNPLVNAFTDVTAARALASADAIDARRAAGETIGPLAGVPFAVKNLFDIAGLPTRAGSRINRRRPPATQDAAVSRRLQAAGAILVGGLNMGEFAYDFTGENVHDGPSRNPFSLAHMTGGSSGGSGAAVAAGLVPIALGSDTNGSIRVPAAFCGVFGLKPTYGRLTRAGSFPFVGSFDHLGPLARSVTDLALAYDAMQGPDVDDPATTNRAPGFVSGLIDAGLDDTSPIGASAGPLRIAVASGYFARGGDADAFQAVERLAEVLRATRRVELFEAARARAAAYVISASEGAALHLDRLREEAEAFDPDVRDRLIAGAMIPGAWVARAQKFRRLYRERVLALFADVDVILAPSTPCRAPRIGQKTILIEGVSVAARPNIGLFTQPISFIGLPVVAVPVRLDDGLPLGVQVIAAPWREDHALRVARHLERIGAVAAPVAAL